MTFAQLGPPSNFLPRLVNLWKTSESVMFPSKIPKSPMELFKPWKTLKLLVALRRTKFRDINVFRQMLNMPRLEKDTWNWSFDTEEVWPLKVRTRRSKRKFREINDSGALIGGGHADLSLQIPLVAMASWVNVNKYFGQSAYAFFITHFLIGWKKFFFIQICNVWLNYTVLEGFLLVKKLNLSIMQLF